MVGRAQRGRARNGRTVDGRRNLDAPRHVQGSRGGCPRRELRPVHAVGAGAVATTAFAYMLEPRHRAFIALFALGCALSSAYGFAIGSVPFGSVEALWSII